MKNKAKNYKSLWNWLQNNAIALLALLVSIFALWNSDFKVKNDFKVILLHEDMEDFFVITNEGNRDQILIDYFYGYKNHPSQNYTGILGANNAEPIVIKPGEKKIIKPRWSLDHFIRTLIDTNYSFQDGPVKIKMVNPPCKEKNPFIIGMAFKYLDPSGAVKVKYFNYAIHTEEGLILKNPILDEEFIYLNE